MNLHQIRALCAVRYFGGSHSSTSFATPIEPRN